MLELWGKIMKNGRIVKDIVVTSDIDGTYQDRLKACITEMCYKFDIAKPYWLPYNLEDYNRRGKTAFANHNFVEDIDFDKLVIEEIKEKKS